GAGGGGAEPGLPLARLRRGGAGWRDGARRVQGRSPGLPRALGARAATEAASRGRAVDATHTARRASCARDGSSDRAQYTLACLQSGARRLWPQRLDGADGVCLHGSARRDTVVHRPSAMQAATAATRSAVSRWRLKNPGACLATCGSAAYAEYTLFPIKSNQNGREV